MARSRRNRGMRMIWQGMNMPITAERIVALTARVRLLVKFPPSLAKASEKLFRYGREGGRQAVESFSEM
jgi:hypothetical protein